jgi:hypothetical protein
VISRSTAHIGALASPAAEPLFRIIAGDAFELDAVVALARISKLAPGQQAQIHVAGGGDLPGYVRLVAPEIDVTTQMGHARITLGSNDKLRTDSSHMRTSKQEQAVIRASRCRRCSMVSERLVADALDVDVDAHVPVDALCARSSPQL